MWKPALLAMLIAAPSPAFAQQGVPRTLSCDGAFAKDSNHARMVKVFGAANVIYTKVPDAEDGEPVPVTVVYPKNSAKRLEVHWDEQKARRRPKIHVYRDDSTWQLANGIGIGTTLQKVEEVNGKPFSLYGFGWDFGGKITDYQGGALARLPGGCSLELRFSANSDGQDEAYGKVSGENGFSSDDPNIRAVKPVVYWMSISWQTPPE